MILIQKKGIYKLWLQENEWLSFKTVKIQLEQPIVSTMLLSKSVCVLDYFWLRNM